jgi:hypothetical protein
LGSVEIPADEAGNRQRGLKAALHRGDFSEGASALKRVLQGSGFIPDTSKAIPEIREYLAQRYGTEKEEVERSERVLLTFLGREQFYPFHCFPQVTKTLGEVGEEYFDLTAPWNGSKLDWKTVQPSEDPIGVIGSTQEPGAKLRAFASPNWVLQAAMEGMKQSLLEALRLCPWDCTHDQSKGVIGVQKWLAEGKTCFSVDLSDATNNFPLELQLMVLRFIGIPDTDLRLLELVSRSPYRLTWDKERLVTWNVGQPLGAGPSFMAFALAHAVLALSAEIAAGIPRSDLGSTFFILGDDFITCDDKVHASYRKLLGAISVPVSEGKCLTSPVAGEFAGKIITESHVYHGYKYREISDISFLEVMRNLGPQALSVLTEIQRGYAELVWELPEPQGLGFNPRGRPLAERYAEYLHIMDALKVAEPDTKTLRPEELRAKFAYGSKHKVWSYFRASRSEGKPMDSGIQPRVKEISPVRIMKVIRGTDVLISATRKSGDPRESPIAGWTKGTVRRVLPVVRMARERWNATRDPIGSPAPDVTPEKQCA